MLKIWKRESFALLCREDDFLACFATAEGKRRTRPARHEASPPPPQEGHEVAVLLCGWRHLGRKDWRPQETHLHGRGCLPAISHHLGRAVEFLRLSCYSRRGSAAPNPARTPKGVWSDFDWPMNSSDNCILRVGEPVREIGFFLSRDWSKPPLFLPWGHIGPCPKFHKDPAGSEKMILSCCQLLAAGQKSWEELPVQLGLVQ